jgi:WS/DGAT/MGAT family acyltransferase
MAYFERLSALDRSFLAWESPTIHMHVGCTMVFEPGPLRTLDGGVDVETLRKAVRGALVDVERYRQRLAWAPGGAVAAWVDDDRFDLDFHLRHVALPRPGSAEQLQQLAAWILQQPLDRERPLWEMWVVEGLAGGRFAVVTKVHHCMVDGIAATELMQRLLSPAADAVPAERSLPAPRPAPGRLELLAHEAWRRATLPAALVRGVLREDDPMARARDVVERAEAFALSLAQVARPASRTPWNGPLGPHRRFDWLAMELAAVRAVSRRLGTTVNDVVLATVAGAARAALQRQGANPRRVRFRVLAPVSVRSQDERGTLGNRISLWVIDLPVGEPRALRRLAEIHSQTRVLKASRRALGAKLLAEVAEWSSSTLLSAGARAATRLPAFNMIVTNVPGPQIPLYLAGARLLEAYPVAPLFDHIGLDVALMSYDGRLFWGLYADSDRVRDLAAFRREIEDAFAELAAAERPGSRRRRALEDSALPGSPRGRRADPAPARTAADASGEGA